MSQILEKFGSTWLGRMLDKKAKRKKEESLINSMIDDCICNGFGQAIGCPAYPKKTCIWYPDNDPYNLKNREWVNGNFIEKSNTTK